MRTNMIRAAQVSLLCAAVSGTSTVAGAGTMSSTALVSVAVNGSCPTFTATPLAFGTVTIGSAATTTSTVTVNCNTSTSYKILMNVGLNGGGNQARMYNSTGDWVGYSLYKDSTLTTYWGDDGATNSGASVSGSGTGAGQVLVAYAQISSGWTGPSGSAYSDEITATLSF